MNHVRPLYCQNNYPCMQPREYGMTYTECPYCQTQQSFASWFNRQRVHCTKCHRTFLLPEPEVDADGLPKLTPGIALNQEEMEDSLIGLKQPSWFFGVAIPIALCVWAIWRGLIMQDTYLPGATGHFGAEGHWVTGTAAIWAGIAEICAAVTLHVGFFWFPMKQHRKTAIIFGVVSLAAFIFCGLMAALS